MKRLDILLPRGQTDQRFVPSALAETLKNLEIGPDQVLRSITGPTLYEPRHLASWAGGPVDLGTPFAVHHARLNSTVELLLLAAGGKLYRHHEGSNGWQELASGLAADAQGLFPPMFVTAGDAVIYCDGASRPLIIDGNYRVLPLGFTETPSAPMVSGPSNPLHIERSFRAAGSAGYAFPGELGTPGDRLTGNDSGTIRSSYQWFETWEDQLGNQSPPSAPSATVTIGPYRAYPSKGDAGDVVGLGIEMDDLTRGVAVRFSGDMPDHAKYRHIWQTPDLINEGAEPRLMVTAGTSQGAVHGGKATADLGAKMSYNIQVPTFSGAVMYKGCLVVIAGPTAYKSDPLLPGTFRENSRVVPDSSGHNLTAVAVFGDRNLAFTRQSITDVSDFSQPVTLDSSAGCVGPKALAVIPGLGLMFLGIGGFYIFDGVRVSQAPAGVGRLVVRRLNRALMSRAVAWYDPDSGDFRCAVAPIGSSYNTLQLCFNPSAGWREYTQGLHIADVAVTDSDRPLQLAAGDDFGSRGGQYTSPDVFVLDRESAAYTPVTRTSEMVSANLSFDTSSIEEGTINHIAVCFIETSGTAQATLSIRTNFDDTEVFSEVIDLVDVPGAVAVTAGEAREAGWDTARIGDTETVPRRRMFWRKVAVQLDGVKRFQLRLSCAYPALMEIVAMTVHYEHTPFDLARVPDATEA